MIITMLMTMTMLTITAGTIITVMDTATTMLILTTTTTPTMRRACSIAAPTRPVRRSPA